MINTRLPYWLIIWASVLLLIFLYLSNPALYYFANDDFIHVPLSGNKNFGQTYLFRPVSEFTLFLDYQLWGKNAFGYHLTNTILHLANVVVVFFFSRRLIRLYTGYDKQKAGVISFVTAALFLVYPFHVEAIYWIVGRGALLGCFFSLLSLHFFLKSAEKKIFIFVAAAAFIAGLLAYEIVFVVPLMAVALKLFISRDKRNLLPSWLSVALLWIIFAAFAVYRYGINNTSINDHEAGNFLHFNFYQLAYNLATFFTRSFAPPAANNTVIIIFFIAGISVLLWVLYYLFQAKREISSFVMLLLFLYLLALLPVLSPGIDTHTTEADRFLYLPSVFFLVGLVAVFAKISIAGKRFLFPVALLSLYFVFCLFKFSGHYQHAGYIAKQSLQAIKTQGSYRNVYVINLPSQYRGATIFRNGFDYALSWMCPDFKFDSLIVINKSRIAFLYKKTPGTKEEVFIGNEMTYGTWRERFSLNRFGIRDSTLRRNITNGLKEFTPGKDILLHWSDTNLTFVKKY